MCVNGDIGFYCMGQGIYVGCGGYRSGDFQYNVGVIYGNIWDDVWVDNYFFDFMGRVDNYCVVGYFCCGICCSVNCYQWYVGVFYFVDVGVGGRWIWVGGQNFYCFCGIDWVVVVEGDNVVIFCVLICCKIFLYQFFCWVWEYFIKQVVRYLMFIQCVKQVIQQVQFYQLIIGNDQCFVLLFICYEVYYIGNCFSVMQVNFWQC